MKSKLLSQYPNLIYGFSLKSDGGMSYKYVSDKIAKENRRRFLSTFDISIDNLVVSDQVHSTQVRIVSKNHLGLAASNQSPFEKTDGLVTEDTGVYLAIFVADCLPIYLYDPRQKIVGLAHAGWKGSLEEISTKTIDVFAELGSDSKDILVFIGPSIGSCHYTIEDDRTEKLRQKFDFWRDFISERDNKTYLDLWQLNKIQLLKKGIVEKNIEICRACTYHNNEYTSWRREGGDDKKDYQGNMIAVLGMRG